MTDEQQKLLREMTPLFTVIAGAMKNGPCAIVDGGSPEGMPPERLAAVLASGIHALVETAAAIQKNTDDPMVDLLDKQLAHIFGEAKAGRMDLTTWYQDRDD